MEIANQSKIRVRKAVRQDSAALGRLLETADYRFRYVDWTIPDEWYRSSAFVIGESNNESGNEISSCLAITPEVLPAGWVRLAALRNRRSSSQLLSNMLDGLLPVLRHQGLRKVGWLAATGWPANMLHDAGFETANWITSYQAEIDSEIAGQYDTEGVRPVRREDIQALAAAELAAFEPIWRLSEVSLEKAVDQALSYDVVIVDGSPVGFQISVNGWNRRSAHLVRITVHPDYQGRGLGLSLLAGAIEGFKLRGIQHVSLNTQVDNYVSHRLYERFGFSMVGDQIPLYILDIDLEDKQWIEGK